MIRRIAIAATAALGLYFGPPMRDVAAVAVDIYETYRPPHEIVVGFSPGGGVVDFILDYTKARQRGDTIKIDGLCISACTLVTGEFPEDRVCVTPFAKLGFHAAFFQPLPGVRVFSPDGTSMLWRVYPPKVRAILQRHGWNGPDVDQPTLIWIEGDELREIFKPCE